MGWWLVANCPFFLAFQIKKKWWAKTTNFRRIKMNSLENLNLSRETLETVQKYSHLVERLKQQQDTNESPESPPSSSEEEGKVVMMDDKITADIDISDIDIDFSKVDEIIGKTKKTLKNKKLKDPPSKKPKHKLPKKPKKKQKQSEKPKIPIYIEKTPTPPKPVWGRYPPPKTTINNVILPVPPQCERGYKYPILVVPKLSYRAGSFIYDSSEFQSFCKHCLTMTINSIKSAFGANVQLKNQALASFFVQLGLAIADMAKQQKN